MRTPPVVQWLHRLISGRSAGVAVAALAVGALAVAALGACRRAADVRATAPSTARLVGVWDATFVLDAPPLGFDSSVLRGRGRGQVRGTLALVANHWLTAPAVIGDAPPARPVVYGTYDVDFSPFGFDPRDADRVPDLVATTPGTPGAGTATPAARANDSVTVELAPASARAQVILQGTWRADSVVGTWRLRSAGRWGTTAGGHFVLVSARSSGRDRIRGALTVLRGAMSPRVAPSAATDGAPVARAGGPAGSGAPSAGTR